MGIIETSYKRSMIPFRGPKHHLQGQMGWTAGLILEKSKRTMNNRYKTNFTKPEDQYQDCGINSSFTDYNAQILH